MRAVLVDLHSIADLKHVGVVPSTGPCMDLQSFLFVEDPHYPETRPGSVIFLTIPAIGDVAGRTPQMADVLRPFPWLVVAPFANADYDRPSSAEKSIAHCRIGPERVQSLTVAPVILKVVDSPRRICFCILIFVSTAAKASTACLCTNV